MAAKEIGIERFGPMTSGGPARNSVEKTGDDLEQIKFFSGHSSTQTMERYLGAEQEIAVAVNDVWGSSCSPGRRKTADANLTGKQPIPAQPELSWVLTDEHHAYDTV